MMAARPARWFAFATLAVAALFVGGAAAQSPDMVEKLNKWFDQNPPKGWTPRAVGEIPTPGAIQTPGVIQIPKGIQAIKVQEAKCETRLSVAADVLFEFDKAALTPDAEETLTVLGPKIREAGEHPLVIEGHTDALGSDQYNQALSERRAAAVKEWLVAHQFVPASAGTAGAGETRPIAPNSKPDGTDDAAGRQRNRRVEVVIDTCH
jgi:outer membrane protein OmpA-like peptidoglycan-associated protein